MLHKRNNSVITLAVLLALVGVSKPAKAFLLAQADEVKTTFTLPDQLPKNATVKVAASNSINSIDQGLKKSFTEKYPNAKVNIKTQSSDEALNAVAAGKTDIAAIGRSLTEAEKGKGLIAVPVSREKIAIVVSKNNPYSGNLSFTQFAQIFKGEITDWSEVGGDPGAIKLVDLPDSNDTRRAFPNYSIFQDGELATGSNAVKVDRDNIDAMVSQLGNNGISYAVADDVIDRDDIKVVSMHQTQPDDPRYPFSQPFNLVYQGTPSEATQAFLGFATTKEGQKTIASRVGSIPATTAAATAIAPNLGNKTPRATLATADSSANGNGDVKNKVAQANGDANAGIALADGNADTKDKIAQADGNTPTQTNPNLEGSGTASTDLEDSGTVNPNLKGSGTANTDLEDSGTANPNLKGSGTANTDLEGSGTANPEFQDSGVVNSDVKESGEVNPDVKESGAANIDAIAQADANPNAADAENAQGEASATKKGNWWWWIPLIIGLPLLGLLGMSSLKRGNRSDREPAIGNTPSPNDPQGGSVAFDPDIDGVSARGTTATSDLGTTSNLEGAAIATGGAALAGGAAATNRIGDRHNQNIEDVDTDEVELENAVAQPETDIDNLIVEIPPDPVNEFTTDQETKLQTTEQSTRLQVDDTNDSSGLLDNVSATGAALGGSAAAASGFFGDREDSVEETTESLAEDNDITYAQPDYIDDRSRRSQVDEPDYSEANANFDRATEEDTAFETENAREFRGDYVLREEIPNEEISSEIEEDDTTAIGDSNWVDSTTNDWNAPDSTVSSSIDNTVTTDNDLDLDLSEDEDTSFEQTSGFANDATQTEGATAGGAALGGAAASGFFANQDSEQPTEIDSEDSNWVDSTTSDWNAPDSTVSDSVDNTVTTDNDLDLDLSEDEDTSFEQTSGFANDATQTEGATAGGAALGGAAASGFFANQDSEQPTEIDSEDSNWVDSTTSDWNAPDSTVSDSVDNTVTTDNDLDLDLSEDEDTSFEQTSGFANDATQTEGATAGGAALGGAAASGFFANQDSEQPTEIDSEDSNWVDSTTSDWNAPDSTVSDSVDNTVTTDNDLDLDLSEDEDTSFEQTSGFANDATQTEGATAGGAALGGAAASGFFANQDSEQPTEIDSEDSNWVDSTTSDWNAPDSTVSDSVDNTVTTDNDLEIEDSDFILDNRIDNDFETNIIADAEVTSYDTDHSLDDLANSDDISLDEITFDDADSSLSPSSNEFAFDETTDSSDISLDEITFDDADSSLSPSSNEFAFDETADSSDISLDEITFDDADSSLSLSSNEFTFDETTDSNDISLDEITLDDADNSIDDLINSIGTDTINQRVDLNELGFDQGLERKGNSPSDLLSDKTAEIDDLANDKSDDMDNISTWLDGLETPDQNTENISEWLENLNADSAITDNEESSNDKNLSSNEENEDISFQFLEDLLDRDPDANQDNK